MRVCCLLGGVHFSSGSDVFSFQSNSKHRRRWAASVDCEGDDMSLRRKLFAVWCGLTIVLWLIAIFGGDASLIALKFELGGWRAAYVHLALTVIMAVGIPLTVFLIGRAAFWINDSLGLNRNRSATENLP
jgi:hypothetical protein